MDLNAPLAERLASYLEPELEHRSVVELRVGLLYAAARLSGGATGLAHVVGRRPGICRPLSGAGALAETPARQMADWLQSKDPVEASVGLAVINAAAIAVARPCDEGDIRHLLTIRAKDRVAMVGHFAPLLPWLHEAGARVDILELEPIPNTRPAADAGAVLPYCDIALITATTLINHTLDDLLSLVGGAREVVLLGPSTPMAPDVFVGTPVTMLAGVEVVDPETLFRIVGEGGSTREFGPAVRKICQRIRAEHVEHADGNTFSTRTS
jgi:uncharacterized protein (DUF4213/DUF364 family)